MQEPVGLMVWLPENIQACLRIFRRAQHQWIARDIMHQSQGVFIVFVLWSHRTGIRPICLIRGRETIYRTGTLHQEKDIIVAPAEPFLYCQRQLFCFVVFRLPAGQTRQMGRFRQASLLAWMNITTWLQGRKPGESNKLFDLFSPTTGHESAKSV